jgi:hypothetical protein
VRATVLNEPSAAATMCEWQGRGRKSIWEKATIVARYLVELKQDYMEAAFSRQCK